MPRRLQRATLAALVAVTLACLAPGSASAALGFIPCTDAPGFSCASLGVPLDRSGVSAGTISLSVERKLAGSAPSSSALLALAGGPGQAALPFAAFTAVAMAAGLKTRDLVLFDQRGTGNSDPLSCPALENPTTASAGRLFERCAEQLGPARGAFTTQESVQDIEAVRKAAGYEKLVLYGTSYGTKVALEYAERYPQHVEALLLDSVVPTNGPEPLGIPTLKAVAPVIDELCSQALCRGITNDPLADVERLIGRLRRRPLSGRLHDGLGRGFPEALDEVELLRLLEAGDLNPELRALMPAAVTAALTGEPDPLLRLRGLSLGLIPSVTGERSGGDESDSALFVTTTCEEAPFPWQRSAGPAQRLAEAEAFAHAQPAADFAPFDAITALRSSLMGACADWPDASPPPPAPSPLPDVPALILSGAQDLRTPTENALKVAALIPDAQVEVVPFTGHSVVGSDLTGCVAKAVTAFLTGRPVQACASHTDPLPPTPLIPTSVAGLRAPAGLAGLPGRTLTAAIDTLRDLRQQILAATIEAGARLPNGSAFGGLHGGYARISSTSVTLQGLTFVPGVKLTGTFPVRRHELATSTIHIAGSRAAQGVVRFGSASTRASGMLGGHRFSVTIARGRLAGAAQWPETAPLWRLGREAEPAVPSQLG